MKDDQEKKEVKRKDFLSFAIYAIGGVISFAIGIPAVAYILGPALRKADEQNWIPLGAASKVELGVPTLFKTRVEQKAGWITNEQELTFYVLTDNGRDFTAMSNVCTHLGCRVRWVDDQDQFFCPCHNAAFDKQGEVVAGPPPRPLDRFDVKVENDQLFVLGGGAA
ncbi:MAG: Rieske 2Fe-2S domain-containing protein [Phycisphaerae bacterium]|nr:Rieske 2Fe-2S domain-containing protein [Phycisphaerae bacterium]NIW10870.1 Rieske 2Fe-2S domain-containing protein [Gammaproteobacteria bacterium]